MLLLWSGHRRGRRKNGKSEDSIDKTHMAVFSFELLDRQLRDNHHSLLKTGNGRGLTTGTLFSSRMDCHLLRGLILSISFESASCPLLDRYEAFLRCATEADHPTSDPRLLTWSDPQDLQHRGAVILRLRRLRSQ